MGDFSIQSGGNRMNYGGVQGPASRSSGVEMADATSSATQVSLSQPPDTIQFAGKSEAPPTGEAPPSRQKELLVNGGKKLAIGIGLGIGIRAVATDAAPFLLTGANPVGAGVLATSLLLGGVTAGVLNIWGGINVVRGLFSKD
ncbi:MAG: hypothetical protein K2X66_15695 [Cyanobacteria bacterium]|nr:hypothetical protein [Cyanobacteriota bacterium]